MRIATVHQGASLIVGAGAVDLEGARSLLAWGPSPPPSFLQPDDLAAMMTGAHAPA
jgi:hypothetical protein